MADFNEAVIKPEGAFYATPVRIDPTTTVTPPKAPFATPAIRRMMVANGSQILVYDVTNPASPVLIQTIG